MKVHINKLELLLLQVKKNRILFFIVLICFIIYQVTAFDKKPQSIAKSETDTLYYQAEGDLIEKMYEEYVKNNKKIVSFVKLDIEEIDKQTISLPNYGNIDYSTLSIKDSVLPYKSLNPNYFKRFDINQDNIKSYRSYFIVNTKDYFLCDSILNLKDYTNNEYLLSILEAYKFNFKEFTYYACYVGHPNFNTTNKLFADLIVFCFDKQSNLVFINKIASEQPLLEDFLPFGDFDNDGVLDYVAYFNLENKYHLNLFSLKNNIFNINLNYEVIMIPIDNTSFCVSYTTRWF